MKKFVYWLSCAILGVCLGLFTGTVLQQNMNPPALEVVELPTLEEYVVNTNVVVRCDIPNVGYGTGSGTIFNAGDRTFAWTAGHVVEDNPAGVSVTYGGKRYRATVLRACYDRDLALLQLEENIEVRSVYFLRGRSAAGDRVLHVGNIFGQSRPYSLVSGIMSNVDRRHRDQNYYQGDFTVYPGCSGGGVFDTSGRYVGMVVQKDPRTESVGFMVPSCEIVEWAHAVGVSWAVGEGPVPERIIPLLPARTRSYTSPVNPCFRRLN